MKQLFTIALAAMVALGASAQKKFSVLGDSYSTFKGAIPAHYDNFYPLNGNDVTEIGQTWWSLLASDYGYTLEKNDSWSGSTICMTGYYNQDFSDRAFITRVEKLGNPDIILVFGGTNDAWANVPMGEYKYSDWTHKELYNFRPAVAKMLSELKTLYPEASVYVLLNTELKEEVNESFKTVCEHYNVPLVVLKDIDKQISHPSQAGMKAIAAQVAEAIAK